LNATGTSSSSAVTNSFGAYSLANLLSGGNYTVTPSKTGDVNSISSFDASLVARRAASLISLTPNQMLAADVSGNGTVSSFDASLIARTAAGIATSGNSAGQWKFVPESKPYANLTANQTGQDYEALLMGEVSGNWTPPPQLAFAAPEVDYLSKVRQKKTDELMPATEAGMVVSLPSDATVANGASILIPVVVGNTTNQGVFSYDLTVSFNPNVLQPAATPFETNNSLSAADGFFITPTANGGQLHISGFSTQALSGAGTLIYLRFNVIGTAGTSTESTKLTFSSFVFNERRRQAKTMDGVLTVRRR
jgi:hypothetical protein